MPPILRFEPGHDALLGFEWEAMKAKEGLRSLLLIAGLVGGWLVLSRVVLPWLGVPT